MKIFAPLSSFPYLLCMRLIFATLADFAYQGDLHFYHVPANDVNFFFLAEQYSFLSTAHFPSLLSVEGTYLHSAGWLLSRVNDKHTWAVHQSRHHRRTQPFLTHLHLAPWSEFNIETRRRLSRFIVLRSCGATITWRVTSSDMLRDNTESSGTYSLEPPQEKVFLEGNGETALRAIIWQ